MYGILIIFTDLLDVIYPTHIDLLDVIYPTHIDLLDVIMLTCSSSRSCKKLQCNVI